MAFGLAFAAPAFAEVSSTGVLLAGGGCGGGGCGAKKRNNVAENDITPNSDALRRNETDTLRRNDNTNPTNIRRDNNSNSYYNTTPTNPANPTNPNPNAAPTGGSCHHLALKAGARIHPSKRSII
jgi:hypothetical protein